MRAPLTHASLPCRRIWFCSSCFCSFSVFLSFFIFGHDYGEIRASDFAQPATRALLEISYGGESVSVSFQDMLGAEGDANTTSLAPASIDVYPLHSPRIIHLFSNSVSQWEHRITSWLSLPKRLPRHQMSGAGWFSLLASPYEGGMLILTQAAVLNALFFPARIDFCR